MIIQTILWMIFIGSAILLAVVILLQEAKGGGLAEAFGGMGAQTFGVKATGINKFTAYVAVVFLLSAVLITCMRKTSMVYDEPGEPPAPPIEGGAAPGEVGPGPAGGSGDTTGDGE